MPESTITITDVSGKPPVKPLQVDQPFTAYVASSQPVVIKGTTNQPNNPVTCVLSGPSGSTVLIATQLSANTWQADFGILAAATYHVDCSCPGEGGHAFLTVTVQGVRP